MKTRRLSGMLSTSFGGLILVLLGCGDPATPISSLSSDSHSTNTSSVSLSDGDNSEPEPTWQSYSFAEFVKSKDLAKYMHFASASNTTSDCLEPIESTSVALGLQSKSVKVADLRFNLSLKESSDFNQIVSSPSVPRFIASDEIAEYRHREINSKYHEQTMRRWNKDKEVANFGWGPDKSLSKLVRIARLQKDGVVTFKIDVYRLPTTSLTFEYDENIFSKIMELIQVSPHETAEWKPPSKLEMSVCENSYPQIKEFETNESYSQRTAQFNQLSDKCIANARMSRRRVRICNIPVKASTQYSMNSNGFHLSTAPFNRLLVEFNWQAKDYMTFSNSIDTPPTRRRHFFHGVTIDQSNAVHEFGVSSAVEATFGFWWPLNIEQAKAFRTSNDRLTADLEFVVTGFGNACLVNAELKKNGVAIQTHSLSK